MNRFATRVGLTVLITAVTLTASACRSAPAARSQTPSGVESSASPTGTESTATGGASTPPAETTPVSPATPPPQPSPSQPAPVSKPKLGPTDAAVSWAYLKDMYQKDGFWYVVVDYVQVVGPEEELKFLNENPRLRTFPLASDARLLLLKSPGSPDYKNVSVAEFKAFEDRAGDEVVEVTPKSGYAIQLKEWWNP